MRSFHAVFFAGGGIVLALVASALPAGAQGLGTTTGSSMSGGLGGGATGAGGLGAGLGGGLGTGTSGTGGTGLGGSNFLQNPSSFLGTGTTPTTTGAGRNFGGVGGGATGSATGTGSAFQGISSSNNLGSYYANPLASGLPTGAAKTRFGAALYNIPASNISGGTGTSGFNRGGTASITSTQTTYPGSSSIGVRRAPAYSTSIGFDFQPPRMNSVQAQAQGTISESTRLPSKDTILVVVDGGGIIVLRGTAGSDHERRLAEALVRLTPGVHELRNELEVRETAPPPRPVP